MNKKICSLSICLTMFLTGGMLFAADLPALQPLDTSDTSVSGDSDTPAIAPLTSESEENAPAADSQANPSVDPIVASTGKTPAVTSSSANSADAKAQDEQQKKFLNMLILYLPNRVMDFLDIADVSVGFGPTAKAQAWITRYMSFGGGIGGSAKLIKAYNRQYGAGLESGWSASFMMLTAENTQLYETTRGVQKYFEYHTGIPDIDDNVYNFWRGPRDIFSIGFNAALLGELDVEIHPFELFDFAAGIFFLDPKGDDIKMADITGK